MTELTKNPHQQIDTTTLMEQFQYGPSASEFARTYNDRTGGCNIHLAQHLISLIKPHLPPPPSSPLRILDSACGPLVLTHEILHDTDIRAYDSVHISAVDINPDFIAHNQATLDADGARGVKVDTSVMNGMDLQFSDNIFDASFTSLGIFAFPDPVKGARELHRTLKAGGVAALTTWKRVGWLALLHEVERLVRPGRELTQLPFLEAWSVPGKLARTLEEGGFRNVVEEEVVSYAWFESEEKAAGSVTGTLKMLVGKDWEQGEMEEMSEGFKKVMAGGSEHVARGEGGKVGFEMVAWTGVGRK